MNILKIIIFEIYKFITKIYLIITTNMEIFDYYFKEILLFLIHGLQSVTNNTCDFIGLEPYSFIEEFVYYFSVAFGILIDTFLNLPY